MLNLISDEVQSKSNCIEKVEKHEIFEGKNKILAPSSAAVKQRGAGKKQKAIKEITTSGVVYTKSPSLPSNLIAQKLKTILPDITKKKIVRVRIPTESDYIVDKDRGFKDFLSQKNEHTVRLLELTSTKVKGKIENRSPISFDKGSAREENKNRKISFKGVANRLLEFLRKIRRLKLTPQEVYGDQEVFSSGPFQKEGLEEFIKAVKTGKALKVEEILKEKGKYLVYDFDHIYALHWAAKKDDQDIARILIEYGADLDARDIAGRTPLCLAIKHNSISVLKLLLAHGAEPWSNEDCNYKKLCGSNLVALYYIMLAQKNI